jgi:putative alpha-1,2-mannosidase
MAAWYVFNALGFYPLTPGQTEYTLGSPLVRRARIHLENGNTLEIDAENNAPTHVHVAGAAINGTPCENLQVDHQDLMSGGRLQFSMSEHPA